jgi:hypothetical protein
MEVWGIAARLHARLTNVGQVLGVSTAWWRPSNGLVMALPGITTGQPSTDGLPRQEISKSDESKESFLTIDAIDLLSLRRLILPEQPPDSGEDDRRPARPAGRVIELEGRRGSAAHPWPPAPTP